MLIILALITTINARAQNEVTCTFTSINSNITTNTSLSATTLYRVEGCIHVTSGITLTVPAGATVLFEKTSDASLIVDKGAYIQVLGTSNNPVKFTSDQQPGFRNPGDYSGLVINGKATNNFSGNAMTISGRTCSSDAGGSDDDDSSGVLKYLRLEYSGYGITLASVGRKTILEDIMVSYPERNAFEFLGGTAQAKRLIAFNAVQNDFVFNYGNRSKVQQALGLRLDASANYSTAPFSNGVLIANSICVFFRGEGGMLQAYRFAATTDPGKHWLQQPLNSKGTAILCPGHYQNCYKLGLHRGKYKALIQSGPVSVYRDANKDEKADIQNTKVETGYFGINIHRALPEGITSYVGTHSAGCQVFQREKDFAFFIALCERHHKWYGNSFTYTLLNEEDLLTTVN